MSKELTVEQALKNNLASMKDQFRLALPSHITPEKFVRTLQTAVSTMPNLVNADRQSLFASAMKAAQDGLLPDGREAAIVTYRSKGGGYTATYMPMVGGILKKVRNSGELSSITSQVVYEKDFFEFFIDEDGEHVTHRPEMFKERGAPIGVYALAKMKDGSVYIEVISVDEVNKVKASSRGTNGPWSGPFEHEMWRKTAIKRLAKRLPMSSDLDFTMNTDNELYGLDHKEESKHDQENTNKKERELKVSSLIVGDADQEIEDLYNEENSYYEDNESGKEQVIEEASIDESEVPI